MQKSNEQGKERNSLVKKIKRKVLHWLHLTNDPVVKVYNGYGSAEKLVIFGHALRLSPLPRKKYRKNVFRNSYGLLRMFMVRPLAKARLKILWENSTFETHTEDDGFFRFEWKPDHPLSPGWYSVTVSIIHPSKRSRYSEACGDIFVPYPYKNTFISDIDDTFLISHSSNLRKRLYVLLTKNARSRKPFESVVDFYQALARMGASDGTSNPFFYVSSSEWNLYDYINEFSRKEHLPKGVYLLNQLKKFSQLWNTGQNNHATKFVRITRIIEAYPDQHFILFGDDSQEDPNIYFALAEYFKGKIHAIYIRHVRKSSREKVLLLQEKIELMGIAFCYFSHSSEAIEHSRGIGLTV